MPSPASGRRAEARRAGGALWLLGRLKLRGTLRRHVRRLRTPKGAFLTLAGFGLLAMWLGSLVAMGEPFATEPEALEGLPRRVAVIALGIAVVSLFGAFTHRGLFLPADEIERLLSAPVSRAQLVRYRLRANAMRALLGGLFIGALAARRSPQPWLAFAGVLVATQTLQVAHQLVAILAGRLELGVVRRVQRARAVVVPLVLVAFVLLVLQLATEDQDAGRVSGGLAELFFEGDPWSHPIARVASAPFLPWGRMIAAPDMAAFLPWFGLSLALLAALFEATARLPIDFRELSLATASDVAARLRRAQRGGGAAAGKVSRRTVGWRVPWLFGHRATGAVAWCKTASILRKARGTVAVSAFVLVLVTWGAVRFADAGLPPRFGAAAIAGLGTLYLAAGLRFDFREELDRMEVLLAWPVAAPRLFFALLLPEACLVAGLVGSAVLVYGHVVGLDEVFVLGVALQVVPGALLWLALDNAVFLFAPVRFVPGQDGALQNAGRSLLLMLLRAASVAVIGTAGWLAFAGTGALGASVLGLGDRARTLASFLALALVLLVADAVLVTVGGALLRRFDLSRDRG